MPSTKTTTISALPSLVKQEMEDRKRSLVNDVEDLAPSRKRIKDEHGGAMRMSDESKEKEVEVRADNGSKFSSCHDRVLTSLQDFQKDAILRQMKEYKRQKKDAEDSLHDLQKKTKYHDDHIRTIDAWFSQLLDEVRILASQSIPTPPPSASSSNGTPAVDVASKEVGAKFPTGEQLYQSALLFDDNATFSEHLKSRSSNIKSAIADLFGRLPAASPDVEDLRKQLSDLLAKEKEHVVALKRALDEKDSLYERLEQAMGRYMTAERKLDRAKSTQVLKLEKQAIMGGSAENISPTSTKAPFSKKDHSETNGEIENGAGNIELENARKEAVIMADKRKAQLSEVESENERLTNELSAARTKLASLTDDDYAETSLFKVLKAKYDEVVKRTNDLEATNAKLISEAQKFQAERTSYRTQIDDEARLQTNEAEAASARAETDVARIRDHRDQLSAELAVVKSNKDSHAAFLEQAKELGEANVLRIAALESEVQRLKLQAGEIKSEAGNLEDLSLDALKEKLRERESQYLLLSNELPSMEAAWKKTQALASKKVQEVAAWEEQVARLNAEKAKADQKYFAAMKSKDLRDSELKTLKSQAARSSEIITQLKDGESKSRELLVNFERQLADYRETTTKLEQQLRSIEHKHKEATLLSDGLKKSVEELKTIISVKDKENLVATKAKREMEEELEKVKVRLEDTKKQYDTLRKSRVAASSTDSDDWRVSSSILFDPRCFCSHADICALESRYLPCLQRQHSQYRSQALWPRLLFCLCKGPDIQSIKKMPKLWARVWHKRPDGYRVDLIMLGLAQGIIGYIVKLLSGSGFRLDTSGWMPRITSLPWRWHLHGYDTCPCYRPGVSQVRRQSPRAWLEWRIPCHVEAFGSMAVFGYPESPRCGA